MNLRAALYRAGYPIAHASRIITRPHVLAAAAILQRDNTILFVRQTYGNRSLWHLPGGHSKRGEDQTAAAVREAFEETGLTIKNPTNLGTIETYHDRKRATLTIVVGEAEGELTIDPGEILEAKWFPLDRPPKNVTKGTKEALKTYLKTL